MYMKRKLNIHALACATIFLAACARANATPMPVSTVPAPTITAATSVPVPATAPTASTEITAIAGDTVVRLTWQKQPNATGYFVVRDGADAPLHDRAFTTLEYTDIGLTNGRTYKYTVRLTGPDGRPGTLLSSVSATPKSK